MIGAADALGQAACALRRADMHNEIDIAPVYAEIERRGGDDGAQPVFGHGGLHPATLSSIQRTVMQGNRQIVVIDGPEFLEDQLRLRAGIDEDQRRLVVLQRRVQILHGVTRRMAGPWDALFRVQDGNIRFCAALDGDEASGWLTLPLRRKITAQIHRLRHRSRKTDETHIGRVPAHTGKRQRQQVATFGGDERM
ncbi:hypothetical protein D3C86_1285470 [compost metagenome]